MNRALIDLRVDKNKFYKENREQIDINWFKILKDLLYTPLLVSSYSFSNEKELETYLTTNKIKIIILSGGGDIYSKKNIEKKRLRLSNMLIKVALRKKISLIGVCRGAQAILNFYNIRLIKIKDHVKKKRYLFLKDKLEKLPKKIRVTCYHTYGVKSKNIKPLFKNIYESMDNSSEVFINKKRKQIGIMWHPEREKKNSILKKMIKHLELYD